jgi:hypothetical protein
MTESEYNRLLLQEYAFWLIASHWDLLDQFGLPAYENDEWKA